ncbi:MAG: branched-chain amino acid ABC transporter substrate-binding protein [bacterium]|nr:branched-chain amino acid ABC transporter substrate-binding protein [bacterium]
MPRILIASLDQTRPLAQKLLESLAKYYQSIGMLSDDSQTASQSIPVADMLLVVMNQDWATDIAQNPTQFTAIADALRRSDLPIMAILADDTTMPPVTALAPDHRAIAYMSAVTIHSASDSFDADVLTLARQMAGYIKETSPEGYSAQTGRAITPRQKAILPFNIFIIGLALLLGVAIIALPRLRGTINPTNAPLTTPRYNETVSARLTGRDLQLGVAAGLSNEADPRGQEMLNGVQLALIDHPTLYIGDNTHAVDLLVQDTTCTALGGIDVANTFITSPEMVAVIGAECEESCAGGATIYDRAGMTTISPACTAPILTQDNHPSFYRIVPSQAYTAVASAQTALANGWNTVVIVHDEQVIGRQLATDFRAEYELGGGSVIFIPIETTTFNMTRLVEQITEATPQAVYFAGRAETLIDLRAQLSANIPLIGGILPPATITLPDNIIFVQLNTPSTPEIESLRARYIAQFGTEPTSLIFAYAYDATIMLLNTVEQIATEENGVIQIDRLALWNTLLAYDGMGVTGRIACAGKRDCAELAYSVYTTQNGQLTTFGGD